ncbi:MAG: endolytic transglycosylase MltG, partial [Erysipelotrichaceae bacterium]|nr:endolytic transglycosylase MltG [Erysipelotrichaceae bacterium]
VVLLAVSGILLHNYKKALKPAQELGENVLFTVNAGDSARTVASNLEKAGLINDAGYSYLYVRMNELTDVKAGEYLLDPTWDTDQIFRTLN